MIFVRLVVCVHARTWTIMLYFFFLLLLQLLLHIVTRPLPSRPSSTASPRCSEQPKTQNPQASKQANKQAEKRDEQIHPTVFIFKVCVFTNMKRYNNLTSYLFMIHDMKQLFILK
jgi:hypothetical protein